MMKFFITLFFLMIAANVLAQDPHFSQFFSSPLTLNPAFTGKFNGQVRAAANYRNQWPTINRAYETGTASVDFPILGGHIPYTDCLLYTSPSPRDRQKSRMPSSA